MVVYGFSLLELRKLYLDELDDFYKSLIKVLQQKGEVKEGSYEKLEDSDTVSDLRRQLFKVNKPPSNYGKTNRR
jgi:hypothetical protein